MDYELHLVKRCEHGNKGQCFHRVGEQDCGVHGKCADMSHYCPGGSVEVLDPERVLVFSWWSGAKEFQVIDVLDALAQEHT